MVSKAYLFFFSKQRRCAVLVKYPAGVLTPTMAKPDSSVVKLLGSLPWKMSRWNVRCFENVMEIVERMVYPGFRSL